MDPKPSNPTESCSIKILSRRSYTAKKKFCQLAKQRSHPRSWAKEALAIGRFKLGKLLNNIPPPPPTALSLIVRDFEKLLEPKRFCPKLANARRAATLILVLPCHRSWQHQDLSQNVTVNGVRTKKADVVNVDLSPKAYEHHG